MKCRVCPHRSRRLPIQPDIQRSRGISLPVSEKKKVRKHPVSLFIENIRSDDVPVLRGTRPEGVPIDPRQRRRTGYERLRPKPQKRKTLAPLAAYDMVMRLGYVARPGARTAPAQSLRENPGKRRLCFIEPLRETRCVQKRAIGTPKQTELKKKTWSKKKKNSLSNVPRPEMGPGAR